MMAAFMAEVDQQVVARAANVKKVFQTSETRTVAVEQASCEVATGDRIALIGPSGSGKSTLLQLLGGLDDPTEGRVCWPLWPDRSTLRPRHIAFVFQMPSLLEPLSVLENVEAPLLLLGEATEDARARARATLSQVGLEDLADKLPEQISGGQAQRIAFARALVARPQLILADEPTGQLDHATAESFLDAVFAALQSGSTSLVVATHDESIAGRLTRHWHMRHGVLQVV
jgi:ABC-type lipoprotein export system ATPase subunit